MEGNGGGHTKHGNASSSYGRIGENSVVAAGSAVTKDLPPNTLGGGNPARVIHSIGDD
jgi:acetyltransferase-like isoleucine patch superfamily enzyme